MALKEYKVSGAFTLAEITGKVRNFEKTGQRFVGAEVGTKDNLFWFETVVSRPTDCQFLPAATAAPAEHDPAWRGLLIAEGKKAAAHVVWRARAVAAAAETPASTAAAASAAAPSVETLAVMFAALAESNQLSPAETPMIDADVVLNRALSALGATTRYVLGGKAPPLAAEAWPEGGVSTDCSAFVAWCFRMKKKIDHPLYRRVNGGWFETTAIHADGLSQAGYFSQVDVAEPGCLVVYPDRNGDQGHMGIVVSASGSGVSGVDEVVHCSNGNFRRTGDAVQVTNAAVWKARPDSLVVKYVGNG